jgi:hypothetical protein
MQSLWKLFLNMSVATEYNEMLSFVYITAEVFPQSSVQCFANKSIDVANASCNSSILSPNCARSLKNNRCNP